ncbi:sn-glycerol-3-phosphate ABC transporter ATP-binding protein UgpC [Shinella sp.]|uniref:ABC transporter ATP-binding protein n=1 Tax=Shinella sp. TaxID=1870904 RepID=UPI00258BCFA4|nr:sn-glycerol-3-phosphate ABC transporter ATP-binding protein UgpC [Shinella sp.]MCW5706894.1 sn-glycerol-3-phosphate ABC transporter ATP-binding protein UgpC [Shinella sp.]
MATLDLVSVGKSFGSVQILKNINLHVDDGSFVVLVGPSGCGKSTLLRMICGLEKVSDGELRIDGQRVNDLAPSDRDIAMVFQSYALYPNLTVGKNMAFPLEMRKVSQSEIGPRVEKAANMLGLKDLMNRLPKQLSGGQRQRVAMGRAIVRDPKVFLFDEPLSNLDAKMRVQMRTEIRELHQELRTTTVYVTHDQIEAMTMGDVVVLMNQGNIEQAGPPLELYDRPANLFVASFIGSPGMNFVNGNLDGAAGIVDLGDGVRVPVLAADGSAGPRKVTLGFRPEHATCSTTPSEGVIPGILKLVEPTGATTQLVIQWRDMELMVCTPERIALAAGEPIYIKVASGSAHLFDAADGTRLADLDGKRLP